MATNILYRSFDASLSVYGGEVSGYVCRWDEIDAYGTRFKRGCFSKTIAERGNRIAFLLQHMRERPVGRITELREDDIGLYFSAAFSAAGSAQDVRQLVLDSAVTGVSFAFIPVQVTRDADGEVFTEVKLLEISLVTIPANDNARIVSARAVPQSAYDDELPLAPRDYAWDSDEAIKRVREWAGGDEIDFARYRRAFMWYDESAPDNLTSYKLPFCDVNGGELHAVPQAIFAIAGGHGVNAADIPDDDKERIRSIVNRWYERMRDEFDDDSLVSPFEKRDSNDKRDDMNAFTERIERLEAAISELRAQIARGQVAEHQRSAPPETARAASDDETLEREREILRKRFIDALLALNIKIVD